MDTKETSLDCANSENIAETLAREMKEPELIASPVDSARQHLLLPPGWTHVHIDDEQLKHNPRRAKAAAQVSDVGSFLGYIKRNGSVDETTVWCTASMLAGELRFIAVLNDHCATTKLAGWRDHTCTFEPVLSEEWRRWLEHNRKPFSQSEFAAFIEDNRGNIASIDGMPTAAQMLEMALSMEAVQDVRFKSAIRLASGGVQLQFVHDDDAQTLARMQLLERFALGLPVFRGGDAFQINTRLRYRVRDAKVTFWYEMERPDMVFEAAARTLVDLVRAGVGREVFFGKP